jgi:hypothetical protein
MKQKRNVRRKKPNNMFSEVAVFIENEHEIINIHIRSSAPLKMVMNELKSLITPSLQLVSR